MGKKGKGRGKGKPQDDSSQGQKGQGAKGQSSAESSKEKGREKSQDVSSKGTQQAQSQGAQAQPSQEATKGRGSEKSQDVSSKSTQQAQRQEAQAQPSQEAAKGRGWEKSQDVSSRSTQQAQRQEAQAQPSQEAAKGRGRGKGRGDPLGSQEPPSIRRPGAHHVPKDSSPSFFSESSQATKEKVPQKSATAMPEPSPKDVSQRKKVLYKQEDQEILTKMTGLSLKSEAAVKYSMAKRPDYGKLGQHIGLYVNYFRLKFKDTSVYHYDIDISESKKDNTMGVSLMSKGRTAKEDIKQNIKHLERQKRRNIGKAKCRTIISEMISSNKLRRYCPVYDGQKNLFTNQPLPYKEKIIFPIDVDIEGKIKRYFVTIQPVDKSDDYSVKKKSNSNEISLQPLIDLYNGRRSEIPLEVLLVYETVMNHREPPFNQVQFRNSFFSLSRDNVSPLGCGLEIWFGYHQSVHLTELGPVVVINVAAKAFHLAGSVISYACDVLETDITRLPKLQDYQIASITDALKGVQVKVTHQRHPRKYKIKALTKQSANELTFSDGNRNVSVAQYFLQKYNTRLKYPQLPCLQMQTMSNTTFIPMETCVVVEGQPKIGKLSGDLTSKMIRSTAVPPEDRFRKIMKTAKEVEKISKNYLDAFGLIMDVNLLKVEGRIIAAPILSYAGNQDDKSRLAKPDNRGVWRIEDGKRFFKVKAINNWVLISFADERRFGYEILSKYCRYLQQSGNKCGMSMGPVNSIKIYSRNVSTEMAIDEAKKSRAEFAVVVLNRRGRHSYDEVKFLSDFKYNLVTQCMEDKTLLRINDQITTNVCLKINVKLGGINHVLLNKPQIFSKPVMVIGADAIHWTRGYGYPSIVSVVASLNPSASRYALFCDTMRNEKGGKISQEIIKFDKMMYIAEHLIKKFQDENKGVPPYTIVVFRDGVSDGQFKYALEEEVRGIQQACMKILNKILPITFIVVQKRHQTRFLPRDLKPGAKGAKSNVPPGTTVDKDITHPVFFDYFVCSHEGIQGTSKPAHYTVLHDDNKFQSDGLQQLCYFLCHTYVRCTRSVSLPAPVLYADLAAFRAKKYADLFISADDTSVSSSSSDDIERDFPPRVNDAIKNMKSFENNMFYV